MRDARANYTQSLDVLRAAKQCGVYTKSSLMLGLGERDDEIIDTMLDMKDAGTDHFYLMYDQMTNSEINNEVMINKEIITEIDD